MKILFVTVGGSYQPIVTAIQSLAPDRVIFICTDGTRGSLPQVTGAGKPCEKRVNGQVIERLANIPTQVKLGKRFDATRDVIIVEPDDLSHCYLQVASVIEGLPTDQHKLQFDYTGGTKTMSAALAMVATDFGGEVYITTGDRTDIIRIKDAEITGRAAISGVNVYRSLKKIIPSLVSNFNYSAAVIELRKLNIMELDATRRKKVQALYRICLGFEAWDRFEHLEAWESISPYMRHKVIQPSGRFLKAVLSSRVEIDPTFLTQEGTPGHGYEIVQDLLLNAERRAEQQRYDDAVGRIYRALELTAQIRLLSKHEIKTGDVALDKLPEAIRDKYAAFGGGGKIQLGLHRSYELLSELPKDPLGQRYLSHEDLIRDALQVRNMSLFAHGFQPVSAEAYQKIDRMLAGFIRECLPLLDSQVKEPTQFPTTLDLLD